MPPSRSRQQEHHRRRKHDEANTKSRSKRRTDNSVNPSDIRFTRRTAQLAQSRITKPMGSYRFLQESRRVRRDESNNFSREDKKHSLEKDLQNILRCGDRHKPTSAGSSRWCSLPEMYTPSSPQSSSPGRCPRNASQIRPSSRSSPSTSERNLQGTWTRRREPRRPLAEVTRDGVDRTMATQNEQEVVIKSVLRLQDRLAEKRRIMFPCSDFLLSVRQSIAEQCTRNKRGRSPECTHSQESDSDISDVSIQSPDRETTLGDDDRCSIADKLDKLDSQIALEDMEVEADMLSSSRTPSPYVLFPDTAVPPPCDGDQLRVLANSGPPHRPAERPAPHESRRSASYDGTFELRRSQPPPEPPPEWVDLTVSPVQPVFHTSSSQQGYRTAQHYNINRDVHNISSSSTLLLRHRSNTQSEEDLVPPTPPPRRKRRRLVPSNFYAPQACDLDVEDDINEGWYCPGQKMF
ncbi:uncharacterized protein LOC135391019 [Ornithodoros turicata]|uniref:uncharacterized protein LOC135391019 n=1 Tax=Ornithodoros turicata TaxID=34597 RepID=UPI0031389A36